MKAKYGLGCDLGSGLILGKNLMRAALERNVGFDGEWGLNIHCDSGDLKVQ